MSVFKTKPKLEHLFFSFGEFIEHLILFGCMF